MSEPTEQELRAGAEFVERNFSPIERIVIVACYKSCPCPACLIVRVYMQNHNIKLEDIAQ